MKIAGGLFLEIGEVESRGSQILADYCRCEWWVTLSSQMKEWSGGDFAAVAQRTKSLSTTNIGAFNIEL